MFNFQNTVCWKIRNTVSHNIKQSQGIHQGSKCNTSLETFKLTQQLFQYARKIHNNRGNEKHYLSFTGILKETPIQRENFWIKKLKTLAPCRLNQELD